MNAMIKVFFSMALALLSSAVLANVWLDCEAWYYGGVDQNGSGTFDQQGEWIDIRHRADANSYTHKANRYNNKNQAFTNEQVVSAASLTTNAMQSVFLDPKDGTTSVRSGIRLPNRVTATGNIEDGAGWSIISNTSYTALFRFRQNDDYPETYANSKSYLVNFGSGQDGNGSAEKQKLDGKRHGFLLKLCNSGSDNQLYVQEKDSDYPTGVYLTNSVIKTKENVWTELAVVATGKNIKFCLIQPGCTPVWTDYTMKLGEDGLPIVGGMYLGYYAGINGGFFKGSFNMAAFWNRALTANEVMEAFAAGAPNLVQLGGDGAGHEMFTSAGSSATVRPATTQDFSSVPATLSEGATLNLQYALRPYSTNLTQVLRVSLHSGSGTFAVAVDGVAVGTVEARAGQAGLLKIDRERFASVGDSVLSLVYSGSGAVLDEVTLGGAWQLGVADNSTAEFGAFRSKRYVGSTASGAGNEEVSGKMDASVAALANTLNYKKNVNNPGTTPNQDGKFQRLYFNVPAEMKERARLALSVKLTSDTPSTVSGSTDWQIRIMVNGETRYVKKAKQTDGSGLNHVLALDKDWLAAGENVVEIRPDGNVDDDPNKGATMTFDCFKMEVTRLSKLSGLALIVR